AETSPSLQAKLLDVLERRVVRALGAAQERPGGLPGIAATPRDLSERGAARALREGPRYPLPLGSPPLPPPPPPRPGPPPPLRRHSLGTAPKNHPAPPAERTAPATTSRLLDHPWPGNVRELASAVERLVLLARGAEIDSRDLPPAIAAPRSDGLGFTGPVM